MRYAAFDSTKPAPSPVVGWYDTDELEYPNLPGAADLLSLAPEQWVSHFTDPNGWAVSGGELVAYTPPVTPPLRAHALLAGGFAVTSTSGGWTALFPVTTDASGENVQALVVAEVAALLLSADAAFADGAAVVHWPDAAGELRALDPTQFLAFARAVAGFVAGCRNVINGAPGAVLPATAATIP